MQLGKRSNQPTKPSFHVLSVKKKGHPAVKMETLCNMYFPISPCKHPDKGPAAD